jgi:polyhydroxybutyrate depolymerase
MGLNGPRMAEWTGLAARGPKAGFTTVFPDALNEVWDDHGFGRLDAADDGGFVKAVVDELVLQGLARPGYVFLVGLSNGAFFAERIARHGLLDTRGLVLVAGTARELSRQAAPCPLQATAVLCFEGTADPMVPYAGGAGRGPVAWMARRRARRLLIGAGGREAVAAEFIAGDWATANGCASQPLVERLPGSIGDELPVDRLSWTAAGRSPVVLYKIVGGGHGWPGGPQYMPAGLVGRVVQHLDATAILLDFVGDALIGQESSR